MDTHLIDPAELTQMASVEPREDSMTVMAAPADQDVPVYDAPMLDRIRTSD
ncbi:MAG: hypothetical protein ACTHLA_01055 [Asticcacaulis sp.]|jgi:hypothetical protein|uniref:hypothetical protein n=1 Tax=Asticcacaulis sp. TaxID=1872648 RepID=UPI003F7B5117